MYKFFLYSCLVVFMLSACAPVNTAPLPIAVSQSTADAGVVTVNNVEATTTPISSGIMLENDVCDNPYYPVVNGAWWQYNMSTGGTPMHSMSANEDKTFTITVTADNTTFTLDGSCTDDGIILLEVPGVSATTTTDGGSSKLTTTNDDGVTLPNDVQIGDDWSQSISVIADGGAGTFSAHIETNYKAVGFEIVSTPYGPINALKVEQIGTLKMGDTVALDIHGYVWYGQGIGVVKTTVDGSFEGTIAAYNIPQP